MGTRSMKSAAGRSATTGSTEQAAGSPRDTAAATAAGKVSRKLAAKAARKTPGRASAQVRKRAHARKRAQSRLPAGERNDARDGPGDWESAEALATETAVAVFGGPAVRPPGTRITVPVAALRPTQITVGESHIEQKKQATLRQPEDLRHLFLRQHAIQVIIGPGPAFYIADHHHWARAWHELGIEHVPAIVTIDLHLLPEPAFWLYMLDHHMVHPYDEEGRRQPLGMLPKDVGGMRDDPYRSLEAFARQSGGYRRVDQAYPDFRWADFFRQEIQGPFESVADMASALVKAVRLARSPKARGLPGYIGKGEAP